MEKNASPLSVQECYHCHEPAVSPLSLESGDSMHVFCCNGCKNVFQILTGHNLSDYYEVLKDAPSFRTRSSVNTSDDKFEYLDFPDFLSSFAIISDPDTKTMRFYLEGIHCLACLWLIERLNRLVPTVISSSLDISSNCVTITITKDGNFKDVAKKLDLIGYRPHPIRSDEEGRKLRLKENRSYLYRIGVAGFAAGNIMLFAVSVYAGADGIFKSIFDITSLLLMIPVIFFSSTPFYKEALGSLYSKRLSIDVPIVIAIILGFVASVINLFRGSEHLFFDSLAALVFLLLSARYFLKRAQESSILLNTQSIYLTNGTTHRMTNGEEIEILPEMVKINDTLLIKQGKSIPADGILLDENAHLNLALLTGESEPVKLFKDNCIPAGSVNLSAPFRIKVSTIGNETRIGKILQKIRSGKNDKATITRDMEQLARYFLYGIFLVATVTFLTLCFTQSFFIAFERALTLLILTCPCALALASPLSLSRSINIASRLGIIIKSESIFEKVVKAKKIFFDKTGTLTKGMFEVKNVKGEDSNDIMAALYSLESKSHHPIGRAITSFCQSYGAELLDVTEFHEIPGKGITGIIGTDQFLITGSKQTSTQTEVIVCKNEKIVLTINLADSLREDALREVDYLKAKGPALYILTGDKNGPAKEVSSALKIEDNCLLSESSPEQKYEIVKANPLSIMIGDGANDSLALSHALVGVAVKGSVEASLLASDVYLTRPGLKSISILYDLSEETIRILKRNLVLSILYNIIGGYFAIIGLASPLSAAILMPVSSLTVLVVSLVGTKRLRELAKGIN